MDPAFRKKLRERLASTAIGPSTIRGLAPEGTIGPAREFLERVALARFANVDASIFEELLDNVTGEYLVEVPALPWGAARKFLNIFLRDCLYNRWVSEDFQLATIAGFLEVPLDFDVADELKHRAGHGKLPAWPRIKNLEPPVSARFQEFAETVAIKEGVHRVDLDIAFWRGPRAQARKAKQAARAKKAKAAKKAAKATL
jgi:hypothetical protein